MKVAVLLLCAVLGEANVLYPKKLIPGKCTKSVVGGMTRYVVAYQAPSEAILRWLNNPYKFLVVEGTNGPFPADYIGFFSMENMYHSGTGTIGLLVFAFGPDIESVSMRKTGSDVMFEASVAIADDWFYMAIFTIVPEGSDDSYHFVATNVNNIKAYIL